MADKPIRVGFVGAGANCRRHHIPKLKAQPGVELVALANRSRESGERVAREFGFARVEDDWRTVVQAPDVDAVCIGTWPYMHREVTVAALGAGKHVLCEARMAMNAAEGREMLAASRNAPHLTAQLVPSPPTLEFDSTLSSMINDGYVGEVLAVELHTTQQAGFVDREAPLHWRQDVSLSGHNILNMGIWYEAILRWLGPARRVTAMTKTAVPRRKDSAGAWRGGEGAHPIQNPPQPQGRRRGPPAVQRRHRAGPGQRPLDLRQRGHAAAGAGGQAADGRAARRQGAEGDRRTSRAAHWLAGRGGVRQRHPRAREDLADHVRGRGALHGVHRRRHPQRGQRPGGRRRRALRRRGSMKTVVALPGEGIGIEVVEATCELLASTGLPLKILTPPQGAAATRSHGSPIPEETKRAAREADGVLFGAAGPSSSPVVAWLRWEMEAFAGVRPIRYYPGMRSPLAEPQGIDYVIVRENSEGLYPGREGALAEIARLMPHLSDKTRRT